MCDAPSDGEEDGADQKGGEKVRAKRRGGGGGVGVGVVLLHSRLPPITTTRFLRVRLSSQWRLLCQRGSWSALRLALLLLFLLRQACGHQLKEWQPEGQLQ